MINLILVSIITIASIIGIFFLERSRLALKFSKNQRLAGAGVLLGICSMLASLNPVTVDGTIVGAAMATPMGAGLLFGGPAGPVAAIIGAIARGCSTPWGTGDFTRLPETFSILAGGIFGSMLRKSLFDDRSPNGKYCIIFTTAVTAIYILLIFFVNYTKTADALRMAVDASIPVWICNTSLILLSSIFIGMIVNKGKKKTAGNDITNIFQQWMFIIIIFAVLFCGLFVSVFQTNISYADTKKQTQLNLAETCKDFDSTADRQLLNVSHMVALEIEGKETDEKRLDRLADTYGISEINIVNTKGIISSSTNPDYVGFDMASGEQSAEFLKLLTEKGGFVQTLRKMTYNDTVKMRYAGYSLKKGGFIQVGINEDKFDKMSLDQFKKIIDGHHIGNTGYYAILNQDWKLLFATRDSVDFLESFPHQEAKQLYKTKLGGNNYYMYDTCGNRFYVVAVMPTKEAMYFRDIASFVTIYIVILVFIALAINLFFLVKRLVIDNIKNVNNSLGKIINGNLDTSVNVNGTTEFASLSKDINSTVTTLKRYISEAGKRIDMELAFAKSIQLSTLPSDFMTDRDDFDIYATMFTAKEVGGDFYDFYMLDGNRLAIIMADVSGKGIPAAMFMMESKAILKNLAERGKGVDEIFTEANAQLCVNNETEMFLTAIIGIVELDTGIVHYANAAHTTPAIFSNENGYEFRKVRPALMLAGMEGTTYHAFETRLNPGDKIFLYTDGVTEATSSAKELCGQSRLEKVLNAHKDASSTEICRLVKEDVDAFVGNKKQKNDKTILAFCYKRKKV